MSYRYDQDYDNQQSMRPQRGSVPAWMKFVSVGLAGVLVGSIIAVGALETKNKQMLTHAQQQIDQLRTELASAAGMNQQELSDLLQATTAKASFTNNRTDEPVVAIAKACQPSIVGITTMVDQRKMYQNNYGDIFNFFFGYGRNGRPNSSEEGSQDPQEPKYVDYSFGSGVILSQDGYIVTNHHVISGSDRIHVILSDGTEAPATLIGSDQYSDIALLRLDEPNSQLVPAEIGDSDALSVGEMVVAIGNPLGVELMGTLTMGVVSATNRVIDLQDGRTMRSIQTDAAINSGNSGGGLFDANGKLIGITNMKISSSGSSVEGLGFAIPINEALGIIESLKQTGKVERPTLGVTVANFTQEDADAYSLQPGIYISEVVEDSAAQKAGLRAMDIITHFDGKRITTKSELQNMINQTAFGQTIKLTIIRDAQSMDIDVTFEKPKEPVM